MCRPSHTRSIIKLEAYISNTCQSQAHGPNSIKRAITEILKLLFSGFRGKEVLSKKRLKKPDMDSSLKNPSYHHQWQPPSAPFPPPPPPISHQFHPERFNRSNQSDLHHQNYHNFTHRQGFPPKPPIKQPPSSYPQPPPPPHVSYESPWISQPYQSAWVGYMEKRLDSRLVDPNYQLDYGNRTRDCSNGVFASDLDSNSRFRDGFSSLGYERKDFGDVRIDESNRDCGQFQPESDGYCRSLRVGTSFAYGNVPYGGATLHRDIVRNSASIGLTGNQRWVETQKDDYYRSEIEPYFDNGKTKGGDEMNRTTNRSQHPAHFSEKRFNSFRVKRKETSCTAGNVLLREVTKKKESFPPPTSSDIENLSRCSEVGVPFAGKSMSSFQSQPCEDEIPKKDMDDLSSRNLQTEEVNDNNSFIVETNTTTRVDSLDGTVVSQAESKNFSQSQACENGVNSSVETVSRKESMETTPLNSTAEVDHNLGSDAGKYTCIISISSSPKNVAEKGSSNVQLVERTSVLLSSICKNKEGWSNGLVFDRELSSAVHLEDSSYAPNQDLGLSSHDPVEIPSVDQSCNLVCRGLKACSSESDVSLSKDTNVGASEFHFNQEVKEKAPTCNNSPVLEIENNAAIGNMGSSGSKTVTDSECALLETQPCLAGCKVFPNDHLGCGASDVVCSFWVSSVEKDRVDVPLRISSCLVPDSSVSVNEQTQNSASSLEANCSSLCGIIERDRAENMDVDIQEEKVKPTGETSQCGTSGTDFVTVSGDSMFLCRSSSTIPGLIIGQIQNETHAAANIDKTKNSKKCNKEEILVDASQGQIITFHETVQGHYPCSGQTSLGTDAESCELPMDKCGDGILVKKTDGKPTEKLTDVPSDLGSEEISLNIVNTDVYVGEARTESLGNSDVLLSKLHSHADDKCAVAQVKDYVVALTPPDSQSMTTLSSKGEKTQKRANKFLHAAQESYPRSLYDTKKDANPPINVTKHHTWHRKSDASASPLVAVKPKVTVQSSSTYVRKGNSLFRKPSPGSLGGMSLCLSPFALQLNCFSFEDKSMESVGRADVIYFLVKTGEAQSLQRHSWPLSDSTSSGKCALSSGMVPLSNGLPGSSSGEADLPDFVQNELKSSDTLTQTGYASDCQPKQYPPKLESLNPSKMLYVKRKANQLVAASDIHGASKSEIPHSGGYFKRSKNQLVRSSESLANQAKSLPVDALDSQTGEKMVSKRSSSSALSEFGMLGELDLRVLCAFTVVCVAIVLVLL